MLRKSVFRYSTTTELGSSVKGSLHIGGSTLHRLRTRDLTLCIPSRDGLLRVSFCISPMLLFETIWRHGVLNAKSVNIPFLRLLGTNLSLTNMLASFHEGEERVISRFTGREATIVVEALALGECRCYLQSDSNDSLAQSSCPTFPLKVDRIHYNQTKPFTSIVNADLEQLCEFEITPQPMKRGGSAYVNSPEEAIALLKRGDLEPSSPLLSPSPLVGLRGLRSVGPEALEEFFASNISLHGYNLFRQSDGCTAVVFAHTSLSEQQIKELTTGLVHSGSKGETSTFAENFDEEKGKAKWLEALHSVIPLSFSIAVQPLAAGNTVEWQLWRLQSALMRAGAALMAAEMGVDGVSDDVMTLKALLDHCAATHTTCQYILSLVTGDYEGALVASEKARQYTHPIEKVEGIVKPIRRTFDINDICFELDGPAAVRTGLDFFCRCSTANLLQTLVNVPTQTLQHLMSLNEFRCAYCGKVLRATPEEWEHLMKRRARHFNEKPE